VTVAARSAYLCVCGFAFMWTLVLCAPAHGAPTTPPSAAPSAPRPTPASSPPLANRLFTTPTERAQLERTRPTVPIIEDESIPANADNNAPAALQTGTAQTQTPPTPRAKPRAPTVNGFVKRSDGVATVWVNDVPRHNPDAEWLANLEPNDVGGDARAIKKNNSNAVKAEIRKKKSRAAVPRAKKVRR
jgi:hypothetical protein